MLIILRAGIYTTVQDLGREGFRRLGISTGGALDQPALKIANLLVGSQYETLQVYLYNMRNGSGHFTSALVISYFAVVLLVTWLANLLNKNKG